MMLRGVMFLFVLTSLIPPPAKAASDQGKVLDRPALARVGTYCVETANLAEDDASVLKDFLKDQSKPKGLFKDLRWRRIESCGNPGADATIKLELVYLVNPQAGPRHGELDRLKGILRVYDNSTSGIIYTAEALPFESAWDSQVLTPDRKPKDDDSVMVGTNSYQRRVDALRRVFSMLIHDVKGLPLHPNE
jgi:hypothetical protein